jgi:high-affinity K+ transport system ATPase subunit B
MDIPTPLGVARWLLLVLALLFCELTPSLAQTASNAQVPSQKTTQAPAQAKSADSNLFPKKMKRTTNEERRAAAARHADRRAAELRKHHGQVK